MPTVALCSCTPLLPMGSSFDVTPVLFLRDGVTVRDGSIRADARPGAEARVDSRGRLRTSDKASGGAMTPETALDSPVAS
jgi:hypothetical protein